jgi:carbonic anhydrase
MSVQQGMTTQRGSLPLAPGKRVAVLARLDARLSPHRLLGLGLGDAHVIRNVGGVIDDAAIRSLEISQNLYETEEIVVLDLEGDVRAGVEKIRASPSIRHPESVRGFLYEVESGALSQVA